MRDCLLALATIFYGVQNNGKRILSKGLRLYVRALSTLRSLLGKQITISAEIVASVMLLSMCEARIPSSSTPELSDKRGLWAITPSSKTSWMAHIRGLESLFTLRGPLKMGDCPALDQALFEASRPVMRLAAFFTQTPSLMSEPAWRPITPLNSSPQLGQAPIAVSDRFFFR